MASWAGHSSTAAAAPRSVSLRHDCGPLLACPVTLTFQPMCSMGSMSSASYATTIPTGILGPRAETAVNVADLIRAAAQAHWPGDSRNPLRSGRAILPWAGCPSVASRESRCLLDLGKVMTGSGREGHRQRRAARGDVVMRVLRLDGQGVRAAGQDDAVQVEQFERGY